MNANIKKFIESLPTDGWRLTPSGCVRRAEATTVAYMGAVAAYYKCPLAYALNTNNERTSIFAALAENPIMTEAEAKQFITAADGWAGKASTLEVRHALLAHVGLADPAESV